jgi:enolase-phosphatase E1
VKVYLLDIEGTTTPITFVHDELYAYARARLDSYLAAHWHEPDVERLVSELALEHQADANDAPPWRANDAAHLRASAVSYLEWLMDRDRKSPALKTIQGWIWDAGYDTTELRGQVWPDVVDALKRWTKRGRRVAIYSSGSELAQRRLFESTAYGDLTPMISAFFDTSMGPKRSPESYRRIAEQLGTPASDILFVSDVAAELTAAREAGMEVVLSVRPGNPPQERPEEFRVVESLEELK